MHVDFKRSADFRRMHVLTLEKKKYF